MVCNLSDPAYTCLNKKMMKLWSISIHVSSLKIVSVSATLYYYDSVSELYLRFIWLAYIITYICHIQMKCSYLVGNISLFFIVDNS